MAISLPLPLLPRDPVWSKAVARRESMGRDSAFPERVREAAGPLPKTGLGCHLRATPASDSLAWRRASHGLASLVPALLFLSFLPGGHRLRKVKQQLGRSAAVWTPGCPPLPPPLASTRPGPEEGLRDPQMSLLRAVTAKGSGVRQAGFKARALISLTLFSHLSNEDRSCRAAGVRRSLWQTHGGHSTLPD